MTKSHALLGALKLLCPPLGVERRQRVPSSGGEMRPCRQAVVCSLLLEMAGLGWELLVRKGMAEGIVLQQGWGGEVESSEVPRLSRFLSSRPKRLRGAQNAFQCTSDI